MELAICSFASSSAGNSFLIQSQSTRILADIGISAKKTEESLAACGLSCVELDGIVLTHEHIDHVRGIGTLLAKKPYRGPVFTTRGTCESVAQKYPQTEGKQFEIVRSGDRFFVGDIEVNVFRISHDAAEPVGYTFQKGNRKIAIVTDTGCVTEEIFAAIRDADILVIEANHEKNILLCGKYPYPVKHRILSDQGHLSNEATGQVLRRYLTEFEGSHRPEVLLAHLSKDNNSPAQAMLTIRNILEENGYYLGKNLSMEVAQREGIGRLLTI